ncbi:MAG: TatD family hydrolase [Candidatus Pristimantibacillus sp.]
MYNGIDAHIHIDLYEESERLAILEHSFESGIEAVIAVSMHEASCKVNRRLALHYPGQVYPAYGFHPEQPIPDDNEVEQLFHWIEARHAAGEIFAIGEVGLPYYTRTEAEVKGTVFDETPYIVLLERFAQLASKQDRPLVLHAVYEDGAKALDILAKYKVRRAHFHWFKGDDAIVDKMIACRYFISISPDVAYEHEIQSLVRRYPLELMMAETDGPWLFEGPYAGIRTEPVMIKEVAKHIAELKQLPVEDVHMALLNNTRDFYQLKK